MNPFGADIEFGWHDIPLDIHPEGGHVPQKRQLRKAEQLKNMARAVMKVHTWFKVGLCSFMCIQCRMLIYCDI